MNNPDSSNKLHTALLTRRQVAETLQTCPHTVARYTRRGLLPCLKINARVIRYDPTVVANFLKAAAVT
jgi:predicted site-specific integrase-resolvase